MRKSKVPCLSVDDMLLALHFAPYCPGQLVAQLSIRRGQLSYRSAAMLNKLLFLLPRLEA